MDNENNNAASAPKLEDIPSAPPSSETKKERLTNPLEDISLTKIETDKSKTDDEDTLKEGETVPLLAPTEDSESNKLNNPVSKPPILSEIFKSNKVDNPVSKPPIVTEESKSNKLDNPVSKPPIVFPLDNPVNQQNSTGLTSKIRQMAENLLSSGESSRPTEYDPESIENEESTPLLSRERFTRTFLDKLWLALFIVLIVLAITIGAFLLIWLGRTQSEDGYFNYILKNNWLSLEAEYESPDHIRKLKLPVHNVYFIELNSTDHTICRNATSYENCVNLLRDNQMRGRREPDILYNFIVDGNGNIYEGRSWERCTCRGDFAEEDLTVAFLINNNEMSNVVPRYMLNFLNLATTNQKLDPCYRTFVYNGTILEAVLDYIRSKRNLC